MVACLCLLLVVFETCFAYYALLTHYYAFRLTHC